MLVGTNPEFFEGGAVGAKLIGGGNMVAMHLAKAVGGNLFLGFISAVAFATILAVVAGLALAGASAVSHDLYARVIMKGKANEASEMPRVQASPPLGLGVVAVLLGIAFEKQNIAFMVALAFAVAACCQLPGAVPLHVLEGPDHARRAGGRLHRSDQLGAVCGVLQIGLGGCAGQPRPVVPLHPTGTVCHAAGLLGDLCVLQAGQQRTSAS